MAKNNENLDKAHQKNSYGNTSHWQNGNHSSTKWRSFLFEIVIKKVSAPKSFANLRTVDGEEHSTFKSACIARGLLQDDSHWKNCLTEACKIAMPKVIRNLFCTMLIHCISTHPKALFEKFKSNRSEDFARLRKK